VRCPSCKEPDTRVVDSRDLDEGTVIRRRRACRICGTRVTTYERAELARLYVIKRTGEREEYDAQKLLEGLRRALVRRPVPVDAAERAMEAIEAAIRAGGGSEIASSRIGALAMAALREIDQIAYIRFASVYQSFEDLATLKREVDELVAEKESGGGKRRRTGVGAEA
jgi:transcriptional repressor NrdR